MSLTIPIDMNAEGDGDGNKSAGRWTQEEHNLFLQGLNTHQKQWKLIADMVKTRTVVQIRTHAQKYFQKLNKTNGSNGWNKFEKIEDINTTFSEHENQRNYTYPKAADSRANSFCSSGDSVDSHGTSAEGVDSESEAQRAAAAVAHGKSRSGTIDRSGSFTYPDQTQGALSGSTSCCSSTLSSPTGSGSNIYNGMNIITRPSFLSTTTSTGTGVLNNNSTTNLKTNQRSDMVRKRSRDGLKSMLGTAGGGCEYGRSAPSRSPRKTCPDNSNNLFIASLKNKLDPDVHPHRTYGSNTAMRNQVYTGTNSTTGTDTTTSGPDRMTPTVHMPGPLTGLPDDLGAGMGLGLDINQDLYFPGGSFPDDPCLTCGHLCSSNDTDLSNAAGFGMNPTSYAYGSTGSSSYDAPPPSFDDLDLMNMLDNIDWNEPVGSMNENAIAVESTGSCSTCNNSRPWSPMTDTASSVSSLNPATAVQRNVSGTSVSSTTGITATAAVTSILSKSPSPVPVPTTSSIVTERATTDITSNRDETDDAPVHKRHRVAFSNVIEELELVSQAARGNSTASANQCSTNTTSTNPAIAAAPEHISLFNLFQRDEPQAVGRLPPLRALVQQARERGCLVEKTEVERNQPTASIAASNDKCSTDTTAPATTTSSSGGLTGLDFDEHEFDFAQFMGEDEFHMGDNLDGPVISLSHSADSSSSTSSGCSSNCVAQSYPVAPQSPTTSGGSSNTISSGASSNLFGSAPSILDANGGINANSGNLLSVNMMPTSKTPGGSNNNTPQTIQRKRGRPRKHSVTHPSAPTSTPSASTAKSLLPALTQSQQQQYVVPVNAAVAQAYNYAVSTALNSSSHSNSPRPFATQRSFSADFASNPTATTTSYAPDFSYSPPGNYYGYGSDIRNGMSRTMSSESDTMMAAVFDPKLYDSAEYDAMAGMLEDFE